MDADRFDALSRALTTPGSRRTILGALLGMLFGGALSGASQESLADRRTRNGKRPGKKAGRAKTDHKRDTGKNRRTDPRRDRHAPREPQPKDEQRLDPADEAVAAESRAGASDEVNAASHGCRHTGAGCTKPGQCCSGRCAGNGTCQLCTRASQCPAPPASEPCQKRVCTDTGKCVIRNKAEGAGCSDGLACTTGDACDGNGRCVGTPDDTLCLSGETCTDGECLCASGKEVCGASCISSCCNQGEVEDCVGGQTCCSGHGCRDLQTDKDHCGECGASCVPDTFTDCVLGECKCGNDPACTDGKICDLDKGGCVCPNGETTCKDSCESDKVWCGDQCLVCPPPPPGIGLPGDPPPGTCCEAYFGCSCGGDCCLTKDDCFQTFDSETNVVVDEFCCTKSGGIVCENQCCQGPSCETGCFRMNPVGGSYRRPGR
jgi:hypothetical protein